jgi:thiol-disulfide isomerase/thioredoxin
MDKLTVITLAVISFLLPIGIVVMQHQDRMAQQQTGGQPPGKVLFFTSPGCGACVRMQPVYEDLRMAGFPIRKVDVNGNQQMAQEYRIRSIPTFVIYDEDWNELGFYSERPAAEKFGTHSGLGLSISRQIVEAHGGQLRAENRRDASDAVCGARFVVSLPAA